MRNKATKKNMDLDLRRYGNNLYSKAEQSGGSDSGDSSDIDSLVTAVKNLNVYLTEDGAKKVTVSGTTSFSQAVKPSFNPYGDWPTGELVSRPIEDYLYVSDINALKIVIAALSKTVVNDGNVIISDDSAENPYIEQSSESSQTFVKAFCSYGDISKFEGVVLEYVENGGLSISYPAARFYIDPNDYTKVLVHPEDL